MRLHPLPRYYLLLWAWASLLSCAGADDYSMGIPKIDAGAGVNADGFEPNEAQSAGIGGPICGEYDWCWELPLPQGNYLHGLWVDGVNDIHVVGEAKTMMRWDGLSWKKDEASPDATINDIWQSSEGDIWAVGAGGKIFRRANGTWTAIFSGTKADLLRLWGSKASDIWAVGEGGTILHYDGSNWSAAEVDTYNSFNALWGSGPNDVWALCGTTQVFHWNGLTWSLVDIGATDKLFGIWGSGPSDIWIVGKGGLIYHYNGATWASVESGTNAHLNDIWGRDANHIWAVGYHGVVLEFDGLSWNYQHSYVRVPLLRVRADEASNLWIVGEQGAVLRREGSNWSYPASRNHYSFADVWASSVDNVWAVGYQTISRFDGISWRQYYPQLSISLDDMTLISVFGSSADNVWAVGNSGLAIQWQGAAWIQRPTPTPVALLDVWAKSTTEVYAIGENGVTLFWNGNNWTQYEAGVSNNLNSLWGLSSGELWSVGVDGLFNWDATSKRWNKIEIEEETSAGSAGLVSGGFSDIWGTSPQNLWMVSGNDVWRKIADGQNGGPQKWRRYAVSDNYQLFKVWGSGSDDIWVAGESGLIARFTGNGFQILSNLTSSNLHGGFSLDAQHRWAAGNNTLLSSRRQTPPLPRDGGLADARLDAGINDSRINDARIDDSRIIDARIDDSRIIDARIDAPIIHDASNDIATADLQTISCVHPTVNQSCANISQGVDIPACYVPPGCFLMGSPTNEPCRDADEIQHAVTLTNGISIMSREVTRQEFSQEMGYDPSVGSCNNLNCPVNNVNWYEAAAFCNALTAKLTDGSASCYQCSGSQHSTTCTLNPTYAGANIYNCPGFRLPTEAEWEYSYRAGSTGAYYNGPNNPASCNNSTLDVNAEAIAWYYANSGQNPHASAGKTANAWGLYDMAGNVMEWCNDWRADYTSAAVTNPFGSSTSSSCVMRGGSWYHFPMSLRAAKRSAQAAPLYGGTSGFRCVRTGNRLHSGV